MTIRPRFRGFDNEKVEYSCEGDECSDNKTDYTIPIVRFVEEDREVVMDGSSSSRACGIRGHSSPGGCLEDGLGFCDQRVEEKEAEVFRIVTAWTRLC